MRFGRGAFLQRLPDIFLKMRQQKTSAESIFSQSQNGKVIMR